MRRVQHFVLYPLFARMEFAYIQTSCGFTLSLVTGDMIEKDLYLFQSFSIRQTCCLEWMTEQPNKTYDMLTSLECAELLIFDFKAKR